jgi:hypothetical protein
MDGEIFGKKSTQQTTNNNNNNKTHSDRAVSCKMYLLESPEK